MGKWGAELVGAAAITNSFESYRDRLQGPVTYVVGTPVEYSISVEFGTSRQRAQPYLRPAVERASRNIKSIFSKASSLAAAVGELALEIVREAKRLCPVDTGNLRASLSAQKL